MSLTIASTRVTLNGAPVGTHRVQWSAAISNDLPGRFSSGDAVPRRTGTIEWANSEGIAKWISPLSPSYPKPGDTVLIETTITRDGVSKSQVDFTGVIDTTKGGMHSPLSSTIIDLTDNLGRAITWDPLIQRMPARQGTATSARWVGLNYAYPLYEAARKAGFGVEYAERSAPPYVDTSLVGSLWADSSRGSTELIAAGRDGAYSAPPFFSTGNGFSGLVVGVAAWASPTSQSLAEHGFFFELDYDNAGSGGVMSIHFSFEDGGHFAARLQGAFLQASTTPGTWETVGVTPIGKAPIGFFYPKNVGDKIWVRLKDQYIETPLVRTGASGRLVPDVVEGSVHVDNAPIYLEKSGTGIIANLLVMPLSSTRNGVGWWQRVTSSRKDAQIFMNLDPGVPPLDYLPSVQETPAIEAIGQIVEKLCISTWIDGAGVLHFESGVRLRAKNAILSVSGSDYEPIQWESEYLHAASSVVVKGKTADIQMAYSGSPIITVWAAGSGDTFLDRGSITYFVDIPDGKDFFEVDTTATNLLARYDAVKDVGGQALTDERWERHWRGYGSVFAVARNNQNSSMQNFNDSLPGYKVFCTIERIGPKTLKVVVGYKPGEHIPYSAPGLPDTVAQTMYVKETNGGMPIVRAGAAVELLDADPLTFTNTGPAGPELLHDMGEFFSAAPYMGEVLNDYFTQLHPYLTGLTTRYDSRITPGVCITIDASKSWGLKMKALVTAVEADAATGLMRVTPRIISATQSGAKTYAELAASVSSYAQLEGKTYTEILGA